MLHFDNREYADRMGRLKAKLEEQNLDGMLLFAQESMFWLTGYDTFGFCFFQAMVVTASGEIALLTRSADLRQARHTSILESIHIWKDGPDARPAENLRNLISDMGLKGKRLGIEYDTVGLTAKHGRDVDAAVDGLVELEEASSLVGNLRNVKSPAEIAYAIEAARLADDARDAAVAVTCAGADESAILAALQGTIFAGGGDYAGNEFILGSGRDALLCRYKSGRRVLDANDQLTLEWAGAKAHYHAAMMDTIVIGKPGDRHLEMFEAAKAALLAVEAAMQVGNTFGDVFTGHADALDAAGMSQHKLNACGYNLGAHFTPCWMDFPMFYENNPALIEENMVLFAHMIIMDSETETAMTLGRTYVTEKSGPQRLSRHGLEMIVC